MILHVPHILLPKDNWEKWAVIACDQHTQDIEYWKRVEEFVGNIPSFLVVQLLLQGHILLLVAQR